ncbi:MAG: hypothetical protein JNM36_06705 [Chitinophagales bacterium]|jgi:hypothetical protein|nr:hypothetical protein [Chitinophagales bacterium]
MSQENINPQGSQIDAMREILFGNNMKQYDAEFSAVRQIMTKNRTETDRDIQTLRNEMNEALSRMEQRLSLQMQRNHEEVLEAIQRLDMIKTDKTQLSKLLVEIGTQIAM